MAIPTGPSRTGEQLELPHAGVVAFDDHGRAIRLLRVLALLAIDHRILRLDPAEPWAHLRATSADQQI